MNSPFQPIYNTPQANAPIVLGRSPIKISAGAQQVQCNGEATLLLQPKMQLIISADLFSHYGPAMDLGLGPGPLTLQYGSNSKPVKALVWGSKYSTSVSAPAQAKLDLFPNPQRLTICANRRKRLSSVTFHVINFPNFFSTGPQSTNKTHHDQSGAQRLGRAVFSNLEWHIELQALPETAALDKELRNQGGYAITHVGQLTQHNGRKFRISAAELALEELRLFLSFVRGLWTPVILPVGFDGNGNRIFEEWGVPIDTPSQACLSWFSRNRGESLGKLYSGFINLLHDLDMGTPVRHALYWYLMSNRGGEGTGIDSGIILSQAALERLSSAYNTKAGLTTAGSTADRLRRAAKSLQLSVAIPTAASSVYRAKRRGIWKDLPEAITTVRNELVHPKAKLAMNVGKVTANTWYLAQWYIELFLLRLSGYDYVYLNRLRARSHGQVEKVPWSQ